MQISRVKRIQNSVRRTLNSNDTPHCQCCNVAPEAKTELIKSTRAAVKREFAESINRQVVEMQSDYGDQFPLIEIPTPQSDDSEIPYEYRWDLVGNDSLAAAFMRAFTETMNNG